MQNESMMNITDQKRKLMYSRNSCLETIADYMNSIHDNVNKICKVIESMKENGEHFGYDVTDHFQMAGRSCYLKIC